MGTLSAVRSVLPDGLPDSWSGLFPPFGCGMNGTTHFEDAPDGRYTATDPAGGFHVAGEIGPLHLSTPTPSGCVLSQWTWLADSIYLGYDTECIVPVLAERSEGGDRGWSV
jgi:hypothetical protein